MARTLFITGASSGIGAETARAAARSGWNVALFARSQDKLETLASEIGEAALPIAGDVTDYAAQEAAVAQAVDRFGGLHAAFANAGRGGKPNGAEKGEVADWRAMVELNVMGLLHTVRATLPELRKTTGHMVLTGSAAGRRHLPGSVYGATKWFVHGFAGNLAEEMKEWGGRCTVVAPGMVDTPFFEEPKPDKLRAEDVAAAVVFALEAEPRCDVREVFMMPAG